MTNRCTFAGEHDALAGSDASLGSGPWCRGGSSRSSPSERRSHRGKMVRPRRHRRTPSLPSLAAFALGGPGRFAPRSSRHVGALRRKSSGACGLVRAPQRAGAGHWRSLALFGCDCLASGCIANLSRGMGSAVVYREPACSGVSGKPPIHVGDIRRGGVAIPQPPPSSSARGLGGGVVSPHACFSVRS